MTKDGIKIKGFIFLTPFGDWEDLDRPEINVIDFNGGKSNAWTLVYGEEVDHFEIDT